MSQKSHPSPKLPVRALFLCLAFVLIITIVVFFGEDADINRRNLEYISALGWIVDEKPCDIAYLCIPTEFDAVFSAYNDIIKNGGFDLTPYKGTHIVRYSYTVLNHTESEDGHIRINIFICRDKIISADISSLTTGGFIEPLSADNP